MSDQKCIECGAKDVRDCTSGLCRECWAVEHDCDPEDAGP